MRLLFSVVVEFNNERRFACYRTFLENNNNIDDFAALPFEPTNLTWSGSKVPILQSRVNFHQSIMALCNTVQLLRHKLFLEQQIKSLRDEIQSEKKRDFTGDK
jgi:hypothetical protein